MARVANYQYSNIGPTLTGAASNTVLLVDDATNNPAAYTHGFVIILTAGTIAVLSINDVVHTFTSLPVGFIIPFPVKRVNVTGTTAVFAYMIPVDY